jgi:hypothetical protein
MNAAGRPERKSVERPRDGGLTDAEFDPGYGYARLSARLATRPDERTWRLLRSARSLRAAIDVLRASSAASYVAGATTGGEVDDVESGLRQHLRMRIRELVSWAPRPWRPAVEFTEVLLDLPAVQHLLSDRPLPRWLREDPRLSAYAAAEIASRRGRLATGPLAPFAAAADAMLRKPRLPRGRQRVKRTLHPLLELWCDRWQRLWPRCDGGERDALQRLLHTVRSHLEAFAALPPEAAAGARERLAERIRRQLHDAAARPAALFAYLLLVALDVERLRGELVLQAAGRRFIAEGQQ